MHSQQIIAVGNTEGLYTRDVCYYPAAPAVQLLCGATTQLDMPSFQTFLHTLSVCWAGLKLQSGVLVPQESVERHMADSV
jgi:hypothetical protein